MPNGMVTSGVDHDSQRVSHEHDRTPQPACSPGATTGGWDERYDDNGPLRSLAWSRHTRPVSESASMDSSTRTVESTASSACTTAAILS